MLSFEQASDQRLDLPGLSLTPIAPEGAVAKFDLTLSLTDSAAGLRGSLDYRTDLFAPETAAQFARLLTRVLTAAAAAPQARLSALLDPDAGEQAALAALERGPDLAAPPRRSVPAQVADCARRAPAAIAVLETGRLLTYRDLVDRARGLARTLRARGVGPEAVVAVCLPRSAGLVIAQLATWFAGGAYLPLDPAHPPERLRALVREAGARAVITQGALEEIFAGSRLTLLDWENAEPEPDQPIAEVEDGQLAYVIFTSGSTGQPKAVAVSHGALANLAAWHREAFALGEADVATMLAGQAFDASVWEIWPALAAGACVAVAPSEVAGHPEGLRDWLVTAGATLSFAPTPLAEMLLRLPWPAATGLRWLLTGGDRLRAAPPEGLPFPVSNNYGPTEHAVVATSGLIEAVSATDGPDGPPDIGRPIARTQLRLLGPDFRRVPAGAVGEIFLTGPSLARGYLGRPELTAEAFVPDPCAAAPGARLYRTGDLARWRPDGKLEFRGRADQQVKIRGVRIELGEIEAALLALPGVAAAAADVRPAGGEPALVARLVAAPDARASEAAVRAALRERLPAVMLPSHLVWLERLPLTPNGKVDRRALPAPDLAGSAGGEPPATPLEETVAAVWAEVLGRGEIGVTRSFFDVGGHSLLLVQVQARLQARLGRPVAMLDLFAHPTVRALAAHLGGAGGEERGRHRGRGRAARRGPAPGIAAARRSP